MQICSRHVKYEGNVQSYARNVTRNANTYARGVTFAKRVRDSGGIRYRDHHMDEGAPAQLTCRVLTLRAFPCASSADVPRTYIASFPVRQLS